MKTAKVDVTVRTSDRDIRLTNVHLPHGLKSTSDSIDWAIVLRLPHLATRGFSFEIHDIREDNK